MIRSASQSLPFFSLGAGINGLVRRARCIYRGKDERSRTQRDAVSAFLVRVASAGILYLSQVVLARWLGAFEYGVYVFVWTWVLMLGGFSQLGLSTTMIRLVPEYRERREQALLRGLLHGGRLLAFTAGTAISSTGLLLLWHFGDWITNHYTLPAFLVLFCVPLYALTDLQDGIGRGRAWIGIALVPPYILRPLLVLAGMIAAHISGLPMNARTAAGCAVAATWIAALLQTVLVQRRFGLELPAGARRYEFKRWLKASLPLLIMCMCDMALQNTDVLVVSAYRSATEVGMYFAAAKTMSLIMFVHYAVGSAVANRFSALKTRGDDDRLRAFVRDAVNWTFWPSLLAAIAILALGKPLLWLFNPQFTEVYPVMFILAIGMLVRASMGPAEFVLNMLGEQALCALVLVLCAGLNVALSFVLVPLFGLAGAAAATSTALVAAALMNYVVARRRLELEISIWKSVSPER